MYILTCVDYTIASNKKTATGQPYPTHTLLTDIPSGLFTRFQIFFCDAVCPKILQSTYARCALAHFKVLRTYTYSRVSARSLSLLAPFCVLFLSLSLSLSLSHILSLLLSLLLLHYVSSSVSLSRDLYLRSRHTELDQQTCETYYTHTNTDTDTDTDTVTDTDTDTDTDIVTDIDTDTDTDIVTVIDTD